MGNRISENFSWLLNGGSLPKKSKYTRQEDFVRMQILSLLRKCKMIGNENAMTSVDIAWAIKLIKTEKEEKELRKTACILIRRVIKKLRNDGLPIMAVDTEAQQQFNQEKGFYFCISKPEVLQYTHTLEKKGKATLKNAEDTKQFVEGNILSNFDETIQQLRRMNGTK
jgi:hypothetical protein